MTDSGTAASPPEEAKGPTGRGGGQSFEKITVNLTERSAKALETTAVLTAATKTDVINQALQFYAYVRQLLEDDGALYVREPGGSEKERLRLL